MSGRARGLSVADWENRRTRLLSGQCGTCIFRPGNPMHLAPGRLRDLIRQAGEGFIVCHATLPEMAPAGYPGPAVCRGFADRYRTSALQIAGRLWGFTEVDPPETTGPHPGAGQQEGTD